MSTARRGYAPNPADGPDFMSVVDHPPSLVRSGRRHGPGLIVLGITSFKQSSPAARLTPVHSFDPRHSLCTRHMAGAAPGLEDEADCQV